MTQTIDNLDPVDPTRRRVLQGALSLGLGLAIPRDEGALRTSRRPVETHIHVNQVGFLPGEPKRALVPSTRAIPARFTIVDESAARTVRFSGELKEYAATFMSRFGGDQRHYYADFDGLSRPGKYRVQIADGEISPPFEIGTNMYARLAPLVLRFFDIQRCGMQAHPKRRPCHLDDGIIVGGPRNGQTFDSFGGWHDAGDFLKFVETTSYVTALMLFNYEQMRGSAKPGGPRGSEAALLAQARVGLEWLLRMHPSPDEFYYQVGDESDHESWRMPEEDRVEINPSWKRRQVYFGVGANLAGRCAAAFAMASRHYRGIDPSFAARCLRAAVSVFELGMANQSIVSTNPASFYPEKTWADDMEWGAVELYRAVGDRNYLQKALDFAHMAGPALTETSVYNTHALAHSTLIRQAPVEERDSLLAYLRTDAELIRSRAHNPYGLATPYVWGTAEAAAGAALISLIYAKLTNEQGYLDLARRQRDFILGCNPFGVCCLIGAGTNYPKYPHHQIANIADMDLPGAIVGGPTSPSIYQGEDVDLEFAAFPTMNIGPPPESDVDEEIAVYHDAVQDYVTNEPAIDYSAKFLLLSGFYA